MNRPGNVWLSGAALATGLLLATASSAPAARDMNLLRLELDRAAGEIKTWLAGRPIQVQPFTCPDTTLANGRILTRLCEEALKRQGVTVAADAPVSIRGTFHDATDADTHLVDVKLHLDCTDNRGGNKHVEISVHEAAVLTLLFPRVLPLEQRKANMVITGTGELRARGGGKFAVQVWVSNVAGVPKSQKDFRLARVRIDQGLARVDIKPGQYYALTLINDSDHDVSVVLSMDGMDTFTFRDGRDEAPPGATFGHRVPKGESRFVYRWYRNPKERGNPIRLGDRFPTGPGNTGFITAQFFCCWRKPDDRPGAQRLPDRANDQPAPAAGKARLVPIVMGDLRESIPVLYDRKPD